MKNLPADTRDTVQSLGREDPLEEKTTTTPVLLSGKFHGQRSLVSYSPRGRKELNTTEHLSTQTHKHTQKDGLTSEKLTKEKDGVKGNILIPTIAETIFCRFVNNLFYGWCCVLR